MFPFTLLLTVKYCPNKSSQLSRYRYNRYIARFIVALLEPVISPMQSFLRPVCYGYHFSGLSFSPLLYIAAY